MNKISFIFPLLCFSLLSCDTNTTPVQQEREQENTVVAETADDQQQADTPTTQMNEEDQSFYVDSSTPQYTTERYNELFDSLAHFFKPKDESYYTDKYTGEYAEQDNYLKNVDSTIIAKRLKNISELTRLYEFENDSFLCYEFYSKVEERIVLGYLLYQKEHGEYKLIEKKPHLLSGSIILGCGIKHKSSETGALLLEYDWTCSCDAGTNIQSGTYDLRGHLLYTYFSEKIDAEPNEDGTTDYNSSSSSKSYELVSKDILKFTYKNIEYKGATNKVLKGKDTTGTIIYSPEDDTYLYENGEEAECEFSIPELGGCC